MTKWIIGLGAACVVAVACYFLLKQTSRPYDFRFLRDREPLESGLMTTAWRSDVIEPVEYQAYNWPGAFKATRARASSELSALGFRMVRDGPYATAWTKGDLDVSASAYRPADGSKILRDKPLARDENWSLVVVRRGLDHNWLTILRVWLFDVRQD